MPKVIKIAYFQKRSLTAIFITFEPDFSRTWNFQGLFLTILSTISEVFETFYRQLIEKWSKNHQKIHIFEIIEWTRFFIKNPAVLGVLEYQYLTSDQKLEKFIVRKYDNLEVDGIYTFSAVGSPLVRTATCWSHESHQRTY